MKEPRWLALFAALLALGLATLWGLHEAPAPVEPSVTTAGKPKPIADAPAANRLTPVTRTASDAVQSAKPPPPTSKARPALTPALLARAVEHASAVRALNLIREGQRQDMPAAWDARAELAGLCFPVISGAFEAWRYNKPGRRSYQVALTARCKRYDDVTNKEQLAQVWREAEEHGVKAATLHRLAAAMARAPEDAASLVDKVLTHSQNPYEILAAMSFVFTYFDLAQHSRLLAQRQESDRYQGMVRHAWPFNARLLYCRLAGGCGPDSAWVLALCLSSGQCPSGAGYREVIAWLKSPLVLNHVARLDQRIREARGDQSL